MAPLPKRRWSTRRQGKKRATIKAATLAVGKCPNCGYSIILHGACPKCGFYRGKQILKIKSDSQGGPRFAKAREDIQIEDKK